MGCMTKETFDEVVKIASELDNNSKIKALGENNTETIEWIWKKYTGKPFDPAHIEPTALDLKRFRRGVKEFSNNFGKEAGFFGRFFKLPKVLAKSIRGGDEFYNNTAEALSYNQRQMKESAQHIMAMTEGMYTMFSDKSSSLYKELKSTWSKGEFKRFQEMERALITAKTPEARTAALREVQKIVGAVDGQGRPIGGRILERYQGLMEFTVVPETNNERMIVREWNAMRSSSMKNLLNGAIMAKMSIAELNKPNEMKFLTRSIDRIQEAIDALLLQSERDSGILSKSTAESENFNTGEMMVYDPKSKSYQAYEVWNPEMQRFEVAKGVKKYFPKYVMEFARLMDNVVDYASNKDKSAWKDMNAAQIEETIRQSLSPERISHRLKIAGETEKYHSMDPLYYLNKYAHDVASFNTRSRVQYAFIKGIKPLMENARYDKGSRKGADVGDYANYMIDMLTEIRDSALNYNRGEMGSMDHVVQLVNSFEYMSKLGFSIRGSLKNRMQSLYNWVYYGKKGYSRSSEFYNKNSREIDPSKGNIDKELTNKEMYERQLKRFGMKMGEKFASIQAATGGSIDQIYIPEGYSVDSQGKLILATGTSAAHKASLKAQSLTEIMAKPMAWAENSNRVGTFKIAFANSFLAEQTRYSHYEAKISNKLNRPAAKKEVYDAIEMAAGNQANDMVRTLHYDYDNWAKARILRSKTGKVLGQYQHFKFAFFDMQYNLIKDAVNASKELSFIDVDPVTGNKIVNPEFSRMFRMASLQTLIPGLAALAFNSDVGGLFSSFGVSPFKEDQESGRDLKGSTAIIDHPIIGEAAKLHEYITADGDPIQKYNAYYGKNPITAQLGPFVSDLLTVAELTDFMNQTSDEYAEHRNLNYDPENPDWWYNVARIFSIQGARTGWHTIPSVLKGQMEKALRIETGVFQPKWMKEWRKKVTGDIANSIYNSNNVLPEVNIGRSKGGSGSKAKNNLAALAALNRL